MCRFYFYTYDFKMNLEIWNVFYEKRWLLLGKSFQLLFYNEHEILISIEWMIHHFKVTVLTMISWNLFGNTLFLQCMLNFINLWHDNGFQGKLVLVACIGGRSLCGLGGKCPFAWSWSWHLWSTVVEWHRCGYIYIWIIWCLEWELKG